VLRLRYLAVALALVNAFWFCENARRARRGDYPPSVALARLEEAARLLPEAGDVAWLSEREARPPAALRYVLAPRRLVPPPADWAVADCSRCPALAERHGMRVVREFRAGVAVLRKPPADHGRGGLPKT